jgi:hypothetical protein
MTLTAQPQPNVERTRKIECALSEQINQLGTSFMANITGSVKLSKTSTHGGRK